MQHTVHHKQVKADLHIVVLGLFFTDSGENAPQFSQHTRGLPAQQVQSDVWQELYQSLRRCSACISRSSECRRFISVIISFASSRVKRPGFRSWVSTTEERRSLSRVPDRKPTAMCRQSMRWDLLWCTPFTPGFRANSEIMWNSESLAQ